MGRGREKEKNHIAGLGGGALNNPVGVVLSLDFCSLPEGVGPGEGGVGAKVEFQAEFPLLSVFVLKPYLKIYLRKHP